MKTFYKTCFKLLLCTFILSIFITQNANAQLRTWTNTNLSTADWSRSGNWNPNAIPTPTNEVLIPSGQGKRLYISGQYLQAGKNIVRSATTYLGGSLNITNGCSLTNNSTFTIASDGVINLKDNSNFINNGTLINNGTFQGRGTYTSSTGPFVNAAGIVIQDSVGVINCLNFLTGFTNDGLIRIQMNGTTPCTDVDKITVTGNTVLGGTFEVITSLGIGNEAVVLSTTGTLTGSFTNNYYTLGVGRYANVYYDRVSATKTVTIKIQSTPLGSCTPTTSTFTQSACDSFYWTDKQQWYYANNNSDTVHLTNVGGCDSLVTLDLTIKAKSISNTNLTIGTNALPYTWNGLTFNVAGSQTAHLINAAGCDSAATLNLTIANPFVTTWKTNNTGTSNSTSITIPTYSPLSYNYDVDWNNDGIYDQFGITGSVTHNYGTAGVYTVAIKGNFPTIYFSNGNNDKLKILSIEQWGNITWQTMNSSFFGCKNLVHNATDAPDLSAVTDMTSMFRFTDNFNGNIGNWDVSHVTSFLNTFWAATGFNQDIGNWNIAAATNTARMIAATAISQRNYDSILIKWDAAGYTNKDLDNVAPLKYCAGATAHANLVAKGWRFVGDALLCACTPTTFTNTQVACDSFYWSAKNKWYYTNNNTDTVHLTNAGGCDSLVTLHLAINHSTTSSSTQTSCDSLWWNGVKYTSSGTYTWHGSNAANCDSAATLHLTITNSTTSSSTQTSCDSLWWNGVKYTSSGTYTWHGTNAANCDSAATLILTINHSTSSNINQTVCDSFTWNGTTYTTSGQYYFASTNASGCTNNDTLNLTINKKLAMPNIVTNPGTITIPSTGVPFSCSIVNGAISYQWNYTATGCTIATGQGTESITADFSSSATHGFIQVVAVSTSGCNSDTLSFPILLPTTLSSFTATKVNKTALVKWTTATEINSKNFEVQRSIDGRNFVTIGTIAAKGFASEYSFVDTKPFVGVNYYRLKQIDNDGKFALSVVKTVKFDTDGKFVVNIYPNPAADVLNVRITNGEAKQIQILNTLGKIVYATNVTTTGTIQLPVKNLSAGTYFIEITYNENRVVEKFIKN